MDHKTPLMGLCPIGKFVFSNEDAVRHKKLLMDSLRKWQVDFVDLEGVLEDGLVKDYAHVDTVVQHFDTANIDCLFVPHCNFGTEGAVGMIAKKLGVPVLLWGPRDDAPLPDGTRLRDSLCGLFASSKVLHKLGVAFSYIENCRQEDMALQEGVDRFLRAVNVANVFKKGVRIGHIGQRIDFFWTTIVNESELLQEFNIEIIPVDMVEFVRHSKQLADRNSSAYENEVKLLRQEAQVQGFDNNDAALINVLAVRDQMLKVADDLGLEGLCVQDFMSLINEMGAYCIYANSMVSDHLAYGCESDIHGAISDVLLRRASFNASSAFLTDLTVRHPDNDNGILLWHAGAPLSMRHHDDQVKLGHHWILPSDLSGMTHFKLKDGPITIARFDGDTGEYRLAIGEGKTIPGPDTLNNYAWMEVNDWPQWERTLIEGPFIHHVAMMYGNYQSALLDACKFVPGLEPVVLP